MCVVLGVDETKRGLCFRGFAGQQTCLCSGFDGLFCFYGMLLGVWGNTVVVLKDHPFDVGKILLVAA